MGLFDLVLGAFDHDEDHDEDHDIIDKYEDGYYVGSYEYYVDEEKRNREEEEASWELGIDPND